MKPASFIKHCYAKKFPLSPFSNRSCASFNFVAIKLKVVVSFPIFCLFDIREGMNEPDLFDTDPPSCWGGKLIKNASVNRNAKHVVVTAFSSVICLFIRLKYKKGNVLIN